MKGDYSADYGNTYIFRNPNLSLMSGDFPLGHFTNRRSTILLLDGCTIFLKDVGDTCADLWVLIGDTLVLNCLLDFLWPLASRSS
jgi:hypothetical protein